MIFLLDFMTHTAEFTQASQIVRKKGENKNGRTKNQN